jgi:Primase C terminal 2 (PriCT-2)/Family of unknown function (DUF5906)
VLRIITTRCRGDTYARWNSKGYSRVSMAVTDTVIARHLNWQPIGVYLMEAGSSETRLAVIDLDDHEVQIAWSDMAARAERLVTAVRERGLTPLPVRSGGGRGVHLWFWWTEPQPAAAVRALLGWVIDAGGFRLEGFRIDIFPASDNVAADGFGNLVALPFARESVALDDRFKPIDEPAAAAWVSSAPVPAVGEPEPRASAVPVGIDDLPRIASALMAVLTANCGRKEWINYGMALKAAFGEAGWPVWLRWSEGGGEKFKGEASARRAWVSLNPRGDVTVASIVAAAMAAGWSYDPGAGVNLGETPEWRAAMGEPNGNGDDKGSSAGVGLDDFFAYMPMHTYIFAPCCTPWPAASVNARLPAMPGFDETGKRVLIPASRWLDKHRPVEQMSWAPGLPTLIRDRLIAEGGWFDRPGVTVFNIYRPPTLAGGDPARAERWIEHVKSVYPEDADHIIRWLAHRVQRPAEKINHALVLAGAPGVGKDSLLEPVKRAIGPWNWQDVSPTTVLESGFNGYLKAVILRINEARDLGEFDRFRFYDHMKAIIASPPDVLRINEKHLREYYIPNLCGIVITTNHKTDGIHLPADDRRHFVAWSPRKQSDFTDAYWRDLWRYYDDEGGDRDVAAYLAAYDLTGFNPKATPARTPAFWDIVSAGRPPEDAELADALDRLGTADAIPGLEWPAVVTIAQIINATKNAGGELSEFGWWLKDRKNSRRIPHRLETCGYVAVRNPSAKDGIWKINGARTIVYGRAELSDHDRQKAAEKLASGKPSGRDGS